MRWNETCTLLATSYEVDGRGAPQPTVTETVVFCNPRHVGANTWSSMYEIGISVDAKLQVRTCDYSGQMDVLYRDEYYSVEVIEETGDFTLLTLRHQQSDSEETEPAGPEPEEAGDLSV